MEVSELHRTVKADGGCQVLTGNIWNSFSEKKFIGRRAIRLYFKLLLLLFFKILEKNQDIWD